MTICNSRLNQVWGYYEIRVRMVDRMTSIIMGIKRLEALGSLQKQSSQSMTDVWGRCLAGGLHCVSPSDQIKQNSQKLTICCTYRLFHLVYLQFHFKINHKSFWAAVIEQEHILNSVRVCWDLTEQRWSSFQEQLDSSSKWGMSGERNKGNRDTVIWKCYVCKSSSS